MLFKWKSIQKHWVLHIFSNASLISSPPLSSQQSIIICVLTQFWKTQLTVYRPPSTPHVEHAQKLSPHQCKYTFDNSCFERKSQKFQMVHLWSWLNFWALLNKTCRHYPNYTIDNSFFWKKNAKNPNGPPMGVHALLGASEQNLSALVPFYHW